MVRTEVQEFLNGGGGAFWGISAKFVFVSRSAGDVAALLMVGKNCAVMNSLGC